MSGNDQERASPASCNWKIADWAVFDLEIVQITEMREGNNITVSDGAFNISGSLLDRLRPLTLSNKRIIEYFAYYYNELRIIRGSCGFNFPQISQHFNNLARKAIDGDIVAAQDKAREFVAEAREYNPIIQGIHLFRE